MKRPFVKARQHYDWLYQSTPELRLEFNTLDGAAVWDNFQGWYQQELLAAPLEYALVTKHF